MSRENIELVRALQPDPQTNIVEFFSRDLDDAALPLFTDDFVCVIRGLSEQPRPGFRGLREGWIDWLVPWESYRTEVEELIEAGDSVLVLVRDFGRRVGMASEIEMQAAALWTVRDGKVARAEFFPDRAEAYEAAGLNS
jgi:ketosteroid isomerase-like protein